jgi:peptidylprolyl isomerase/peptidyl-prolyl cis-trans isomerase D
VVPADHKTVRARHILKRAAEGDAAALAAARQEIIRLRGQIRGGEDFATVAQEESDDIVSGAQGGSLGWFGPGKMTPPFEDAAFGAAPGALVGPVETQFGVHLIEIQEVSDRAVRLADFAQRIRASGETLQDIEDDLDDLKFYAEEQSNFAAEAERRGLAVQTVEIEDGQQFVPGLGNSRTLLNFLEGASRKDVSPVIELNDRYVVASVIDVKNAGFRPFDEVRAELEPRVKTEKRKGILHRRLADARQSSDNLEQLALAVGSTVQNASVRLDNPVVAGLGREPAFAGTAAGVAPGQMSRVVDGNSAVYVVQPSEPALTPMTEADKESLRQQLRQQRQNLFRSQWIKSLRDRADIVDNRRRLMALG